MVNDNYKDLSGMNIDISEKEINASGKYPGIYVFGRLLGQGERPIILGAANYYKGITSAGGKLLLTNKSLSFSAHKLNVGKLDEKIDLKNISSVELGANFIISQHILVNTKEQQYKFVVYHGKDWVQKIRELLPSGA